MARWEILQSAALPRADLVLLACCVYVLVACPGQITANLLLLTTPHSTLLALCVCVGPWAGLRCSCFSVALSGPTARRRTCRTAHSSCQRWQIVSCAA